MHRIRDKGEERNQGEPRPAVLERRIGARNNRLGPFIAKALFPGDGCTEELPLRPKNVASMSYANGRITAASHSAESAILTRRRPRECNERAAGHAIPHGCVGHRTEKHQIPQKKPLINRNKTVEHETDLTSGRCGPMPTPGRAPLYLSNSRERRGGARGVLPDPT